MFLHFHTYLIFFFYQIHFDTQYKENMSCYNCPLLMHINNSFTYTFKAAIHHEEVKNMYKSTGPTHAKFHSQIPYLSILLANMLQSLFYLAYTLYHL